MIDEQGFRAGIGIIVTNSQKKVFWARRIGQNAWQFPQGGIKENEAPIDAMYRELYEEIGLPIEAVRIIASTEKWLRYRLPKQLLRRHDKSLCIGQKQKWFLLALADDDQEFRFDTSGTPEFDGFRWVNYWYPLKQVIHFKRRVYQMALKEFAPYLNDHHGCSCPADEHHH